MCFACFACVFLLRCHYWLHVACIAVLVLACVYILVMVQAFASVCVFWF